MTVCCRGVCRHRCRKALPQQVSSTLCACHCCILHQVRQYSKRYMAGTTWLLPYMPVRYAAGTLH